jgi:hypothetical protein
MGVAAIKEYTFEPADRLENFHGNQLLYIGWDRPPDVLRAVRLPMPPAMRFGDIVEKVLPGVFGYHPDFAKIDWSKANGSSPVSPGSRISTRRWPSWASSTRTCCASDAGPEWHQGFGELSMSYELTIEPLGQTIEVEEGQTILDAACAPASGCRTPAATACAPPARCRWWTARSTTARLPPLR